MTLNPKNRAETIKLFGDPGQGAAADPGWEHRSIITVRDMPGVPSKWYFQCHRLAEPLMREGFRRAQVACPAYRIERAASYVYRHMRHDPHMPLSDHSWGIAIDVDPETNGAKTFRPGLTPAPWSKEWRQVWPHGLPRTWVEAMESAGFAWGGRWKQFCDPMHFSLVGGKPVQPLP